MHRVYRYRLRSRSSTHTGGCLPKNGRAPHPRESRPREYKLHGTAGAFACARAPRVLLKRHFLGVQNGYPDGGRTGRSCGDAPRLSPGRSSTAAGDRLLPHTARNAALRAHYRRGSRARSDGDLPRGTYQTGKSAHGRVVFCKRQRRTLRNLRLRNGRRQGKRAHRRAHLPTRYRRGVLTGERQSGTRPRSCARDHPRYTGDATHLPHPLPTRRSLRSGAGGIRDALPTRGAGRCSRSRDRRV